LDVNSREVAAFEVHRFLAGLGVKYAIIGGVAVQYWGESRFTQDIDLTVSAPLDDIDGFIQSILDRFTPRIDDALSFAKQNRVVLVMATNGYPVDIALGLPGYEDEVLRRAVEYSIAPGSSLYICSAEDLIIHKAVAGRAQDIRDIEGIIYRQGDRLDGDYIRRWLADFSEVTGKPDLAQLFEIPWRDAHRDNL
jgi:predicted nucleotidyltransferase